MGDYQFHDLEGRGRRSQDALMSSPSDDSYDDSRLDFGSSLEKPSNSRGIMSYLRKFSSASHIRLAVSHFAIFLIPSFLTPYIVSSAGPSKPTRISQTAWLDGLRGIACFIVVIYHSTYMYFASEQMVYDGVTNTSILQLPIIRLLYYGPPMVKIFYIISGFVLTYKAVGLTRVSGPIDLQALMSNLSSSIWKRYLRLFLPCVGSFLLCAFLVWAGTFETVPEGYTPAWIRGKREDRPPMKDDLFSQLAFTVGDFYEFAILRTFFGAPQRYVTDVHLWTIPVEFRESIRLFVLVAGGCMLRRRFRMFVMMPFLFTLAMYHNTWEFALFLFGFFLAELHADLTNKDAVLPENSLPATSSSSSRLGRFRLANVLCYFSLFFGLYFSSYPYKPSDPKLTTGFACLHPITPPSYKVNPKYDMSRDFWQSIGCALIVWPMLYMPRFQRNVLCNRLVQYLGKISFALYLVHGHTNRSVGYWTATTGWKIMGIWYYDKKKEWGEVRDGNEGARTFVVFVTLFVTTTVSIWAADIFWRAVDVQSVRFVRWLENKVKRA